jgi:hypothetical protein
MYGYEYERRKIARLKGTDYLWLGILGQVVGGMVIYGTDDAGSTISIVGQGILILFTGVLVGGCTKFVRYYGMNRWWALLGIFNVIGVGLLIDLPRWGRGKNRGAGFDVEYAEPYRRDVWRMDVRVKLDEVAAANVREPIMLQVPRGANVGSAMKVLAAVIPGLFEGELPGAGYWINGVRADRRAELSDGDELVVRMTNA